MLRDRQPGLGRSDPTRVQPAYSGAHSEGRKGCDAASPTPCLSLPSVPELKGV